MNVPKSMAAALAMTLSLPLGGCSYDYLQHTDRVSYHAGNAVRANLERETINPSRASMYSTSGLGKNGVLIPPPAEPATTAEVVASDGQ